MNVIHIQKDGQGYEVVKLVANRYSDKVNLPLIQREDEKPTLTAGLIVKDTPQIRQMLDSIADFNIYEALLGILNKPIVRHK